MTQRGNHVKNMFLMAEEVFGSESGSAGHLLGFSSAMQFSSIVQYKI